MLGDHGREDAAADVEISRQTNEPRFHQAREIVDDAVRDRLVERTLVAERPDVELQRLQLDALSVWHVLEVQRCEVRLACLRTETGEFRDPHPDRVVTSGLRVGERLEDLVRQARSGLASHDFLVPDGWRKRTLRPSLSDCFLIYTTTVEAAIAAVPCSTTTGLFIAPDQDQARGLQVFRRPYDHQVPEQPDGNRRTQRVR